MTLGDRLRKARERRGWNQRHVSKISMISNTAISNYERNYRDPDTDTLKKFADLYGVSIDYLMGRTNDPNQIISEETADVLDSLELSDEDIRKKFPFEVDGRPITDEEFKWFIASVRSKRSMD